MIELKNISKTYKSKKSTNTVALKDISIKFPDKGLVFILGKSGSGKSTLLNIIGGLDKCDNGEVIINGKSTKEFKEKDFDAYRNTYMGFVFQEYNLLENYSVEKNIKLALELQHKKATSEEIQNVLKQVDLDDISKRKINELSGGQKQRVAIARAIIKNPEIILADEPTGNLDSQTSTQIWQILKKLSKTKLVIVVSHDSESATKYASRIIRIQDGEIVSDNGNTTPNNKPKEFKLQKAKLPFLYCLKMGAGSLFHKKVRLVLSTLLIVFSLICLGVMASVYSTNWTEKMLEIGHFDEFQYIMKNSITNGITTEDVYAEIVEMTNEVSKEINNFILQAVIFFLIFAAIILMTFINSSIKFRKKEIGTLRALGCRSIDIIKMFLYESVILMLIALAISFLIVPSILNSVNEFIMNQTSTDIEMFEFGIKQILEITVTMLIIVILGNIIPVRKVTKQKPIDTILDK